MIKVPLALAYIKRSLRPLYANTQATPKSVFLDPAWDKSVDIYPGMATVKQTGQQVTLVSGAGDKLYGLANFYEAPVLGIKEITDQGINATSVWVLGPDAEFIVDAPAFDASQTWTDGVLVTAIASGAKRGQLAPVGGTGTLLTQAFARVLSVNSPTSITIGGLQGTV
jgi:hypothetical protein